MPIVLVHGNPETATIWDDLRRYLGRSDVITLSPPGFGAPVPEGFGATSDEYVTWLAAELGAIDGPIDLIGHDFGVVHVFRVVASRPDLVRSWAIDIAGVFDPDYVWHDIARVWQTPGAGEEAVASLVGTPTDVRARQFQALGMSAEIAAAVADAVDETMGQSILSLYRSAVQPKLAEWGADVTNAKSRPGLAIIATEDPYGGGVARAQRTAERTGARVAVLEGLGHWWMCQDPQRGANAITQFLASVEHETES